MLAWLAARPLVLASRSQARHLVLEQAGIPHIVAPADIDERQIERQLQARAEGERERPAASGAAAAALLAREKALIIASRYNDSIVLGADQTLALGQQRFSKPDSRTAAREQLAALRGKTHELHSALAVARGNEIAFEYTDSARLTMRAFSDTFLDDYLDSAATAVMASVGGYQLERSGIQLFERIEGDYFTILGLPLLPLLQFLRQEGLLME